jgi:tetratricopeptide (TPR) repeat protein
MREQAVDLRLALWTALLPSSDLGRVLALLRETEALAEALDDPRRLGQVVVSLANIFWLRGAYDQAIAAGHRALALAIAGGDVGLHAVANLYLGFASYTQGDYCGAIDCLAQTMTFFDGTRRRERFGVPILPAMGSRGWLAACHAELGTFTEGIALGDEGLRMAETVDHPASLMIALWGMGLLALRQGDLPEALPRLERAVGLCRDADVPLLFPRVAAALGAAHALSGRVADAVPLLTQALEQSVVADMVVTQALCRFSLGEAQLLAGRPEEAQAHAEQALRLARAHQERGHEAYALRLLGEIAAQRDPPEREDAEAHYRQALALTEALGMRPLQAHCRRGLGTLYTKSGQREPARAELSSALELYRAMDMTFWLPQAEAALAQVEGR